MYDKIYIYDNYIEISGYKNGIYSFDDEEELYILLKEIFKENLYKKVEINRVLLDYTEGVYNPYAYLDSYKSEYGFDTYFAKVYSYVENINCLKSALTNNGYTAIKKEKQLLLDF